MSRRDSAAATRFDLSAGAMVRLEGGGSVRSGRRGHDEAGGTGPVRSGHQGHGELDPAAGAMARLEGRARNDNSVTSSSPSSGMMGSSNRENVESIVYASMNEDDNNNSSNGAVGPAQEGLVSHAILSGDDEARSMRGIGGGIVQYHFELVSLDDCSIDRGVPWVLGFGTVHAQSPISSPHYRRLQRRNARQQQQSRRSGGRLNTIDPFSHDQRHCTLTAPRGVQLIPATPTIPSATTIPPSTR